LPKLYPWNWFSHLKLVFSLKFQVWLFSHWCLIYVKILNKNHIQSFKKLIYLALRLRSFYLLKIIQGVYLWTCIKKLY
jgi:hypothetical protein